MRAIKQFIRRVKRTYAFLPIIWRGYDFDYRYAIDLFSYQLERTADFMESDRAMTVDAKVRAKRIRTAIELLNMDSLVTCRVGVSFWEEQLYALIQMHYKETSSQQAEEILQDWDTEKSKFLQICPKEMLDKLSHPLSYESDAIPAE